MKGAGYVGSHYRLSQKLAVLSICSMTNYLSQKMGWLNWLNMPCYIPPLHSTHNQATWYCLVKTIKTLANHRRFATRDSEWWWKFKSTADKMAMFKSRLQGLSCILRTNRWSKAYKNNSPLYAHNFPVWAEHTSAMHQYAIWNALAALNIGANHSIIMAWLMKSGRKHGTSIATGNSLRRWYLVVSPPQQVKNLWTGKKTP